MVDRDLLVRTAGLLARARDALTRAQDFLGLNRDVGARPPAPPSRLMNHRSGCSAGRRDSAFPPPGKCACRRWPPQPVPMVMTGALMKRDHVVNGVAGLDVTAGRRNQHADRCIRLLRQRDQLFAHDARGRVIDLAEHQHETRLGTTAAPPMSPDGRSSRAASLLARR